MKNEQAVYRYRMDPVFHRLVDGIRSALRADIIGPTDVSQALDLAVDLNRDDDDRQRVAQMLGTQERTDR